MNATVRKAVALARITVQQHADTMYADKRYADKIDDIEDWRNAIEYQFFKLPHKSDKLIGATVRGNTVAIAVLTTHASRIDADAENKIPHLIVLRPWEGGTLVGGFVSESGGCSSYRTDFAAELKHLGETYNCWQLNQLFGHDGKFDDLPKHIAALLAA